MLADALAGASGRWGHAWTLSTGDLGLLRAAMGGVEWVGTHLVDRMRLVKYDEEVVLHREAARLGDVMLAAGRELVEERVADGGPLPSEAALAKHVAIWARWNYAVLAVGMTVGKLGFGRKDHVSEIPAEQGTPRPAQPYSPQHVDVAPPAAAE